VQIQRVTDRQRQPEASEAWALCPAFEHIEVSTLARVRYVTDGRPIPRGHRSGNSTKVQVAGQWVRLSWLVAVCHVPNSDWETFTEVGFRDGNKGNASASNLYWRKPVERIVVIPASNDRRL